VTSVTSHSGKNIRDF